MVSAAMIPTELGDGFLRGGGLLNGRAEAVRAGLGWPGLGFGEAAPGSTQGEERIR